MNNHDENKKYFKSTFKVFHAPDNIAKEVLDMAKKLNQEDNTNSNQDMISYQVESVSHHNFGKWIAVASACVLIVGSGVYFNNLGSENVANQIEEDNSVSLGLSTQIELDSIITNKQDTIQTSTNTEGRLIEYSPNVDTATAETIHCDGSVIHVELSTDNLDSINSIIDSTIIWSEMSNQDYEEWTSKTYNDYIRIKVKHTNNNTETEYLIYQHCVIMLQGDNISISTTITGDQFGTILSMIYNVPMLNDVNYILNDLIPNSVAIIDENGTLTEYSATENYDLSEINDILQAQEWTVQPVQEGNQESAIIFCTDYTYNQDDNNIFIENTSYVVLYQDGSLYINNNNTRGMVYSQNGSQLYNTIYDKLRNMQNEYTFKQTATLFGIVEIPTNATVYYSTSSDDLHYNSEKKHYTDEIEFSGTLNAQAIQKINELSNTTLWTKTDEPPYAGQSVICINLNDSYSGYGCSFAMYDNGISITYEDNTEEYYTVDSNLIQQIISVIDEYAEPTTFQTDSHNLFGIIPMDESTSFNAVISSSTGGESGCILNYFDLLKINELSCYNMWQQLTSNPISQDFYYETCVSLKNDNYSIQILDTTIIVTYPDGAVEYYSTMETCGTDTFAQNVQSLVYERSRTQIID